MYMYVPVLRGSVTTDTCNCLTILNPEVFFYSFNFSAYAATEHVKSLIAVQWKILGPC